jgi:hypothetical protein
MPGDGNAKHQMPCYRTALTKEQVKKLAQPSGKKKGKRDSQ